jgi:hypothetical protein
MSAFPLADNANPMAQLFTSAILIFTALAIEGADSAIEVTNMKIKFELKRAFIDFVESK